jgi:hypothetical protein
MTSTHHLIAASLLSLCAALPAAAHSSSYTATLLGSTETSPNNSAGTGTATITLDEHALTMRVQASFSGLSGAATMAHVHCCTAVPNTGNAGVAIAFADFPTGARAGSYDHTFDMSQTSLWNGFVSAHGGTVDAAFGALGQVLGDGTAYFNIHSVAFGGGELRGNFASAVPEPGKILSMTVGLAGIAVAARRRKTAARERTQA